MAREDDGKAQVDLTISIATWDNRELVAECLRLIPGGIGDISVEVFVADNASSDGTAEMIRTEFPHVRLIENKRPLGFSANHNQVLRRAAGRFVLLLNDDTVVGDNALLWAVRFLENHDETGAVGCTLVKPDGTPEPISQRFPHPLDPIFPSLREKVSASDVDTVVGGCGCVVILPKKQDSSGPCDVEGGKSREQIVAVEVDRLSGACLMIRREVLDQVGLLDEQFDPCYGEDTDLCYRIKQAGWRIFRLPDSRVTHYRGRTARRELPDQARRLQESKYRWYRKHRSRSALRVYRATVVVASLAQLMVWLLLLLVPGRRAGARSKIRRLCARLRARAPSTRAT